MILGAPMSNQPSETTSTQNTGSFLGQWVDHARKQYGSIGGEFGLEISNTNESKSRVDSDVWKEWTKNYFLVDLTASYWTFAVGQTLFWVLQI